MQPSVVTLTPEERREMDRGDAMSTSVNLLLYCLFFGIPCILFFLYRAGKVSANDVITFSWASVCLGVFLWGAMAILLMEALSRK